MPHDPSEAGPVLINQGTFDNPWQDGRSMTPSPEVHATAILRDTRMWPWSYIGPGCTVVDSEIREFVYAVSDNQIFNADVGKFCNIASGVRINPTNHPTWRASLHHFTYRSRSHGMGQDDAEIFAWRDAARVVIGPDVWIGHNAILLPGVNVGAGAVVGAGAIVTRDVAPYAVVVGSPARIVKRRVTPDVEAALMRIRWWDWPNARLAEAMADFRGLDTGAFAAKYDTGG